MSDEQPTVGQLLLQSRAENLLRLKCGNRRKANYPQAEAHAATALRLREWAHELDPEHADPEWKNDTVPHAEIVEFLKRYPDIP